MDNALKITCQYTYRADTKNYHFVVGVSTAGMPEARLQETVVSRFELTQMNAFKGSHHKRAAQFAQALINEKEVAMRTALRQRIAQINQKGTN